MHTWTTAAAEGMGTDGHSRGHGHGRGHDHEGNIKAASHDGRYEKHKQYSLNLSPQSKATHQLQVQLHMRMQLHQQRQRRGIVVSETTIEVHAERECSHS